MRGPKPKPVELRVFHGTAARIAASVPKPRRKLPQLPGVFDGRGGIAGSGRRKSCMMPAF